MPKADTPLPQLIKRRIEWVRNQVQSRQWAAVSKLDVEVGPLNSEFTSVHVARKQKYKPIRPGDYFCKRPPSRDVTPFYWKQRWFRVKVPTPKAGEKGKRHLYWLANGETTIYYRDKPWGGLDACHGTCLLPDSAGTLLLNCGTWQTGVWGNPILPLDEIGLQFVEASLRVRDEVAWQTYLDLDVLCQWVDAIFDEEGVAKAGVTELEKPPIGKCKPVLRRMLKELDDAMDEYDRHGIEKLASSLKRVYRRFKAEPGNLNVSYVGHAHLDLVWLWPERATYQKAIHTFATMANLMRRYPEFVFSMSQPVLMDHIRKAEPEQHREIMALLREKQWEATGGLMVESDTHMPVGEGLARALIYGQERFRELRGTFTSTVWIPDVFGYSQCLPQVFSLGGIKYFYTQKMTWSAITRFPHNSFIWKGPDGSSIVTHLANTTYISEVRIAEALQAEAEYRQSDVHDEVLVGAGFGDGGGGVTEEHIERARRMKDLARVPRVSFSSAEDFFDRLGQVKDDLPVYRGELYMEYHRGTYTTQSDFKYYFRRCEKALQAREAVRVMMGMGPLGGEQWLRYIFAQFHDAIPGSSIREVYEEMVPELTKLSETQYAEARREWRSGKSGSHGLFNPTMISRTELVELPLPKASARELVDREGSRVPYQIVGKGVNSKTLACVTLRGLESRAVRFVKGGGATPEKNDMVKVTSRSLDNGLVNAGFDADGQLKSLRIKGRDMGLEKAAGFDLYIDNPADYDAWDIDHSANWLGERVAAPLKLKVLEQGPLRSVLHGSSRVGAMSTIEVDYILESESPYLKVEVCVNWHEDHKLLRYTVPTGFKGADARYGCAFGSVGRSQLAGRQAEEAQWEVPGSRWMSALDGRGEGLSIVSEAKYGFRCKDGVASVSLLRSPLAPDPVADRGTHRIRFALGMHRDATEDGNPSTAAAAESLYTPFLVLRGAEQLEPPFSISRLGGVVPSWVMPSRTLENAYVIRMHETACAAERVTIEFVEPPAKVFLVDFFENRLRSARKLSARRYEIPVKQGQIVSVKVEK